MYLFYYFNVLEGKEFLYLCLWHLRCCDHLRTASRWHHCWWFRVQQSWSLCKTAPLWDWEGSRYHSCIPWQGIDFEVPSLHTVEMDDALHLGLVSVGKCPWEIDNTDRSSASSSDRSFRELWKLYILCT